MAVIYEWDVETQLEYPDGENDVIDHHHFECFSDALSYSKTAPEPHDEGKTEHMLVLVRDDNEGRSWAYLDDDGTLPEFFMNADGKNTTRVPKRFHEQVARAA